MIKYFCIQDGGKTIQQYTHHSGRPPLIERTLTKLGQQKIQSKVIQCLKNAPLNAYYFQQDSYLFVLITAEPKKQMRIHKYLNTIAELFYEEYDPRYFKEVLKYAVEEINKAEAGEQITEINLGDEDDRLVGKIVQERFQLKRPPKAKAMTRANVMITILFVVIVVLGWVYLAQR